MAFSFCVKIIRHGFSLVIVSDEVSLSRNDCKEKYLLLRKGLNSRVRISNGYLQWALTIQYFKEIPGVQLVRHKEALLLAAMLVWQGHLAAHLKFPGHPLLFHTRAVLMCVVTNSE